MSTTNEFICLGDFNLRNKFIDQIHEFCKTHSIKQLIKTPTRENNILDLIFMRERTNVSNVKSIESYISDHNIIECTISVAKPLNHTTTIKFRQYKNCLPSLINHLDNMPSFYDFEPFHKYIIDVFDTVCPLVIKKITNTKNIRLSKATKFLIRKRSKLHKSSKKRPMRHNTQLVILKKQVKQSMLRDSKLHFDLLLKESNVWSAINKIAPLTDKKVNNLSIDADNINDHYVSISTNNDTIIPVFPTKPLNINPLNKLFTLNPITVKDICNSWNSMKNKHSNTVDPVGFCNKMIDLCMQSNTFLHTLVNIFNVFIEKKYVPTKLKISRIVPIPKIDNPISPNDTRPIAIQPVITKILDKCILKQLEKYFEENNFISNRQFGFKKGSSTVHALTAITDTLYINNDRGDLSCLVSLDIQKAFDKVNRVIN